MTERMWQMAYVAKRSTKGALTKSLRVLFCIAFGAVVVVDGDGGGV